jgi:hypothetical protein
MSQDGLRYTVREAVTKHFDQDGNEVPAPAPVQREAEQKESE